MNIKQIIREEMKPSFTRSVYLIMSKDGKYIIDIYNLLHTENLSLDTMLRIVKGNLYNNFDDVNELFDNIKKRVDVGGEFSFSNISRLQRDIENANKTIDDFEIVNYYHGLIPSDHDELFESTEDSDWDFMGEVENTLFDTLKYLLNDTDYDVFMEGEYIRINDDDDKSSKGYYLGFTEDTTFEEILASVEGELEHLRPWSKGDDVSINTHHLYYEYEKLYLTLKEVFQKNNLIKEEMDSDWDWAKEVPVGGSFSIGGYEYGGIFGVVPKDLATIGDTVKYNNGDTFKIDKVKYRYKVYDINNLQDLPSSAIDARLWDVSLWGNNQPKPYYDGGKINWYDANKAYKI
jgi:hypothetical protein